MTMSDRTTPAPTTRPSTDPNEARRLFRYVTVEEWRDYRAIMSIFADTYFAEFAPDDVTRQLAGLGTDLDVAVVADRLEQLRAWGNLTVSSSVGNPSSIADYYKRRHRYLITRAGQEVHELIDSVLSRVDEVRDVSTGRLRTIRDELARLIQLDIETCDPTVLTDSVRAIFDPHQAFTSEITQFFAAINQWQARYDLMPDEFRFFAEVLVGYVGDRLDEIERMSRPIGVSLAFLEPSVQRITERMAGGLADRVEAAGLADTVSVTHQAGSDTADWDHLRAWFRATGGRPSRIERLSREAVAAIRTLTLNLTRLSRVGVGASSRRADFLRLAQLFAEARDATSCHHLAAGAFGLFGSVHLGVLGDDAGDPTATSASWWEAPRAAVAISLRERGDTNPRGQATPLRDRRIEAELIRRRRQVDLEARAEVDAELLAIGDLDGATVSVNALSRVQLLLGRATHRAVQPDGTRRADDLDIVCVVRSGPGQSTTLSTVEGSLTLLGLRVTIEPARQSSLVGT